jgi:hypothetical protein
MAQDDQALFSRRVDELIGIVTETVAARGANLVQDPIVVGQRLLLRVIPFVEPLARNGAARRDMLVRLLEAARTRVAEDGVRSAISAVQTAMSLGLDSILVDALQDTNMLARSAAGCGGCLLALFNSYFRRHSRPGPAPPAAAVADPGTSM